MGSQLSVLEGNIRRNLSDPTGGVNAPYYTSQEIKQYIGDAYKNYYKILVNEGEGYFETSTNISLVANQALYSLSALSPAFFSIHSLERVNSRGTFPLKEAERMFRPNYSFGIPSGDGYYPTYRLQSLNLLIEPTPQFSESNALILKYYYLPTFPSASSLDSFQFDDNFSVAFETMIELYATIRALEGKDGVGGVSDMNTFRERLKDQEESFMKVLNRFDYPDDVQYSGQNYSTPFWWWY